MLPCVLEPNRPMTTERLCRLRNPVYSNDGGEDLGPGGWEETVDEAPTFGRLGVVDLEIVEDGILDFGGGYFDLF